MVLLCTVVIAKVRQGAVAISIVLYYNASTIGVKGVCFVKTYTIVAGVNGCKIQKWRIADHWEQSRVSFGIDRKNEIIKSCTKYCTRFRP